MRKLNVRVNPFEPFCQPFFRTSSPSLSGLVVLPLSPPFWVERKVFILSCADRQQSGKRSNTSTRRTKEPRGWPNGKWEMGWGPGRERGKGGGGEGMGTTANVKL